METARDYPPRPARKISPKACSIKMAGYWSSSFFFFAWLWASTASQSINTQKKKELDQYPAILTSHLVSNPYMRYIKIKILGISKKIKAETDTT